MLALAAKTSQIVESCGGGWICAFVYQAAQLNLGVVLLGGLAGGLLQPIFARLNPDRQNPSSGHFAWSALLGVAAAGISVYVIANSETGNAIQLLFFSLLCGLAFPSVLTSAVDSVSKQTQDVQDTVAKAAEQARSNNIDDTSQAAKQLKNTLARNPAGVLASKGVTSVEATAQIAVQNIADTATGNPGATPEVINQLQQVETVARTTGYEATAKAAAEEIRKLSEPPAP